MTTKRVTILLDAEPETTWGELRRAIDRCTPANDYLPISEGLSATINTRYQTTGIRVEVADVAPYAPEPPIGSIVTDAGNGWPWVRTVGGSWTRDACQTFLTWPEVYAWVQAAVDDPDDDTDTPFRPVLMKPVTE